MTVKIIFFLRRHLLSVLPYILVFISSLYIPHDPDLGWHLKYGEYFFNNFNVQRENIYTAEMPDYKWANTSWVTDLITYTVFSNFSFLGLTILGALIITLTFYVFSKIADLSFWDQAIIFPIILLFEQPVNSISFRGQLISILFLGLMFYLIKKYQESSSRHIFLVIPLFLLWVNLHGQSILGLGLFLGWIFFYLISLYFSLRKGESDDFSEIFKSAKKLTLIFILSILATLINPFGIGIYYDALSHFGNPNLQYVAEYLPLDSLSAPWWHQMIIGILILFGIVFLFFEEKIIPKIPLTGIILVLLAMSFWVKRYAWSLYYLTMPLIKPLTNFFKPDSNKGQEITAFVILTGLIALVVFLKSPFSQFTNMSWDKYCKDYLGCSFKATQYLLDHKPKGKMLTLYDWGGYLIWNYPQIKPTIDGRMHLWRDEKGYSAFANYYAIEQNMTDIDETDYQVAYISNQKTIYGRLNELTKQGKWKLTFQDGSAAIFERVN